jgi:galactose mutarotase-like enzyme
MSGVELASNDLTVNFKIKGAELCSVKNKQGIEFMWQANPLVWPRHAPILFPIVGKLLNNSYRTDDKVYELNQHGFARDLDFKIIEQTPTQVCFELNSDSYTNNTYPFEFNLKISYRLEGSLLTSTYAVYNPSKIKLPFSIGAHPGFKCPILPHEKFEDYYLEFEKNEFELSELNNGLRTTRKNPLALNEKRLDINQHLFNNDALVFENQQINEISLCSKVSAHKITLKSHDWPYFGIWAKKNCAEFICLEPWYGIADTETTNQQLKSKEGIRWLEPKTEFSCFFTLQFS